MKKILITKTKPILWKSLKIYNLSHIRQAKDTIIMFFKNGYGVSVVRFKMAFGYGSYTDNDSEWELAVLFGNEEWTLTYNTPITDDVIGHLTGTEVTWGYD